MSGDREDAPAAPDLGIPNAADEGSQRRIRDRVRREEAEAVEFYRALFRNRIARREMWRLLEMGHPFQVRIAHPPEKYGAAASEATWLLLGEQQLACKILRMWQQLDFDGVVLMQRENDHELMPATK